MKANRQPHSLNALRRRVQHRQMLWVFLVAALLLAIAVLAQAEETEPPDGVAYLPLAAVPGPSPTPGAPPRATATPTSALPATAAPSPTPTPTATPGLIRIADIDDNVGRFYAQYIGGSWRPRPCV